MCRCSEIEGREFYRPPRKIREKEKNLKIRAFYLKIGVTDDTALPETMTLVYLPTITGGSGITEINGATSTRSGGPVLLSLHRTRSAECSGKEAVFASTDRVRASDGTRFEVYVGDGRAVEGILRKRRKEGEEEKWEVECRSGEVEMTIGGVCRYDVRIVGEGGEVLRDKVSILHAMTKERRRKRKGRKPFCMKLEEIPEEEEEEEEGDDDGSVSGSDESGSWCSCCCGDDKEEMEGEEWELVSSAEEEVEVEAETVRWAVDVGIWVVSLGVGLLVSKAALSPSRRRRSLLF